MSDVALTSPATQPVGAGSEPSFDDLGLPQALLDAVTGLGFTTPTPIQTAAIPALLSGRDLVGVAQTGTGKTAAFGLPLLAAVDPQLAAVQALVLTPTRELAIQVSDAVASFVPSGAGVKVLPIYGGASFVPQLRGLERGAQVVVGTPGRVIDLLERGSLDLDALRYLVLDEADEMLRMGFAEDVDVILAKTPATKQVALFSATMPPPIRKVAETHLRNPEEIAVARQATPIAAVTQTYAIVPYRNKAEALSRVLATSDADAAIVFVRTRETAEEVGTALASRGINAASISGDVAQRERERIVERLRSGALDVLVATDVAARGLDVERIGLVVNFDVPREVETYVHRIGRTGRAGRTGNALTFLTPKEKPRLRTIERVTGSRLVEATIPTNAEVAAHRTGAALATAHARLGAGDVSAHRERLVAHVAELGVDPLDVAAALLALAVGDDGAPAGDDLALPAHDGDRQRGFDGDRGRERGGRRGGGDGEKYRIAVGHRDGVSPQAIVGAITGEGGLRGADIGKIDIFPSFSLVEIPGGVSPDVARRIGAAKVAGRPLRIRLDDGPPNRGHRSGGGQRDARGPRDSRRPSRAY
ncbi:DEAD/DEAH box helicase domain protein [Beutenbergia cavernae DSM 12333]|uniref:RNA helicase n=1 Tax=Beutenbergia cavernae (strain ATCC BAA-8 / DSM 12333 / CCUG 43141 / JCM 11478 / NBRC 16432 / NCIMB 13614 / HKI 0122) TaxID=471853 RepID=C5C5R9_BEUC1|nr:DEAD/DEAH box helicase [Beutenbergia cavernae]ACQ80260.1 DEAD/DEAH box helicase domain protein [Beutenbergia cavernae DSM 12333]